MYVNSAKLVSVTKPYPFFPLFSFILAFSFIAAWITRRVLWRITRNIIF